MSGLVKVVDAGLAVTVQDRGRLGYRSIGVPVSGALDPFLLAAANALLGNAPDAAALEIVLAGPALKIVSGPVRIALVGELSARLARAAGCVMEIRSGHTVTLFPGDVAKIGVVARGAGYVGISGGFEVPLQLGSRSTYLRASLGGFQGRALAVGDRLPCGLRGPDSAGESCNPVRFEYDDGPIRVILGPQEDHFSPAALKSFFGRPYRVTRDADRMGMRLEGPPLEHSQLGADIVSDGVVPGAIQVPANGKPIILLADCQTTGGYPKIATVIRADLPRLSRYKPGDEIRFRAVDHAEAAAARQAQTVALDRWVAGIRPFSPPGMIDEAALYGGDLISGAVRGDEPGSAEKV